jgi:hypothetical protein
LAVTDEIIDLYSSILNGTMGPYAETVGGKPIDLLVGPAVQRVSSEHTFLVGVAVKDGTFEAKDLDADIEVMKNGFNALTNAVVGSLSYVFGRDDVVKKARGAFVEASGEKEQLIEDAKINEGLPAFLSEGIWEEV